MKRYKMFGSILASASILLATPAVQAAMPLRIAVNESRYVPDAGLSRVAVGSPEIADVQLLSANEFLLVGKKAGSTTLLVWSGAGRQEYIVTVSGEDVGLAGIIQRAIGLPGVILGAIRKEKPDIVLPAGGADDTPKPLVLTKDEVKVLKAVAENVSLAVDKKEGYITLNVVGSEPIQTAELAMKAQQLLQDEITRFRIEKSESELEYIQARYDEIKQETEMYQEQLARITDRSQSTIGTRNEIERNRIQSKYTTANTIYNELAKQLEQAKLQVKRDTPVLTVIQPVTVPDKPSNSRAKTLIVWTFFGAILGCGIVLARGYWPKLKEQFKA